jgi:hypothetical protein
MGLFTCDLSLSDKIPWWLLKEAARHSLELAASSLTIPFT